MTKHLKVFMLSTLLFWMLAFGASGAYADGERITGTINRISKNVNGPFGRLYELDFILVGDNRMFATRQYANWEKNFMVFAQHGDRVTFEVAYTAAGGTVVVRNFAFAPECPAAAQTNAPAPVNKHPAPAKKKKSWRTR